MADLDLSGPLNFVGVVALAAQGGKVLANGSEVLVETQPGAAAQGNAPSPVMIPPPPAGPQNQGVQVNVICSFNKTVTAGGVNIVTQGIAMQGQPLLQWPGMVLPSSVNTGPTAVNVNEIPMNVLNDEAVILPSGMSVLLTASGQ